MPDTLVAYLHKDEVSASFFQSYLELTLNDRGVHIGQDIHARANAGDLPVGRNQIMKHFLETSWEWLFMVDTDMGFQPGALAALHEAADPVERPIVGGLCFAQRDLVADGRNGYQFQPRATIFDYLDEYPDGHARFTFRRSYPVNGLVQCSGTGAAFILIHRSVGAALFNRFGARWFDRMDDRDGLMSEDLSFFKRCLDVGIAGPCFVHTGVRVSHHKPMWINESDYWRLFETPPAADRVDVIIPVLHRPQNVELVMRSLTASTGLATAWFVCDPGDVEEIAAVERCGGRVVEHPGSFAQKVNYAYRTIESSAPWIFLAGDDVMFHPGWLDHAQFVGESFDGQVVGTNDLGNPRVKAGDHAVHMMIRRSYIDEVGASWDGGPGTVCHEGYGHWFVDDEIVNAARQRNAFQMALGSIVEHMHPLFDKALDDDVYRKGQESADKDRLIFEARAHKYLRVAA